MTKQEYNKTYYAANRLKLTELERQRRVVNGDKISARDLERRKANRPLFSARTMRYYYAHQEERHAYNRSYYRSNVSKIALQKKEYVSTNRQAVRDRNNRYAANNRDKARRWNKKWALNNRPKVVSYEARRRALENGAVGDFQAARIFFGWVRNQDVVTCTYCGAKISGKAIHIDHIVPLSRGGHHEPDNFCVSCQSCNSSKGDLLLSEWRKCPEKFKLMKI